MFGGGLSDCDHHVWGTGFRNRGEMASRFRSKTFWWRRIVLYPISNAGVPPFLCFQVPFSDWGEYTWRVVAPAKAQSANLWRSTCTTGSFRRGCQRRPQHARCNSWMRPGSSRIHVRARPSRWNRRGKFGVQERCRYLWYRHAARILGWCDRKKFPDLVTGILRAHVFPTPGGEDETTREDGKGGVAAGARAGSIAIDAAHLSAGQSS